MDGVTKELNFADDDRLIILKVGFRAMGRHLPINGWKRHANLIIFSRSASRTEKNKTVMTHGHIHSLQQHD